MGRRVKRTAAGLVEEPGDFDEAPPATKKPKTKKRPGKKPHLKVVK